MKLEQRKWDRIHGWMPEHPKTDMKSAQLILIFGARSLLKEQNLLQRIKNSYLQAHTFGYSTAGEIYGAQVLDDSIVTTAIMFEHTQIRDVQLHLNLGDVPEGSYARLMKANFDRLIDGAVGAAKTSFEVLGSIAPDLAVLISCVGRKLILKQRIEEVVEGVRDVFGERTVLAGFYSYGEIAPFVPGAKCELHNQSMTSTTLLEE